MSNGSADSSKITKKDLKSVYLRWLLGGQTGWNYERMQGLCYCFSMMPVLRKLYTKEEDLKKAVKLHLQFFNTEPDMAHLILGANVAIEENQGLESEETITAIKTGLMGPFAGVGDTIFGVIANTVFGSIAAYMALAGNSLGIWIWLIWNIARWFIRWEFTKLGYTQGLKIATVMEGTLKSITEVASILGLTVVGALIPTVITPSVPAVFKSGEVSMEVQGILDQIMPSLVPVALVFFVYWLLGRKKMTSTKAIWILLAISIILGAFGILS
ncbi:MULTISPECIES: PTS system mannose/fructose/sorbose family transporter subunit IID [Tissierellales]|jgi:PTS system mannose-specific IID component|uniref:PTS system mannose/fructose/sorbose family transporter subunit IID n=1 Tax=Acidilutibacter cellobiosedens TaxID=2507161 RepID=A0A410QG57_9FIRM|nr:MULTISPECIES: PTS system mannose/fructose/sorbose family transporter subunit IID [Tissierellales]MBE6083098.1 PTS system mannose/fructose/sorbose family transporter subunit IID [Tissierellaceae bacterium]QAT62814.1 PTS system mannose/fructose/sorbose family transporter subunit IID [Acidilutibacter cellobiosedens]SCL93220.1 PTS system mannose-specific EIID component [Sporanaerobacter sp. PP17-6a]